MSEIRAKPEFLLPQWEAPANVVALTSSRTLSKRAGGYAGLNLASHVNDDPEQVSTNRQRLAQALADKVDFQWLDQVHGTRVIQADRTGAVPRGDAVFTAEAGIACCVLTADCLPVFFASRQGDAVAVAHAGWRGLAAGILEKTLADFPSPATDTVAWLGPAIGPCHFEVGPEVRDAFLQSAGPAQLSDVRDCFKPVGQDQRLMADLYQLARLRLSALQVHSVSGGQFCTYCDDRRFYSFRREQVTGRMASLIYIKP